MIPVTTTDVNTMPVILVTDTWKQFIDEVPGLSEDTIHAANWLMDTFPRFFSQVITYQDDNRITTGGLRLIWRNGPNELAVIVCEQDTNSIMYIGSNVVEYFDRDLDFAGELVRTFEAFS